jgi:prepilin-type N-terminal cleavage/methylation domain-containing protein
MKKQRGFTLVELLVVIAIIAALAAIGFNMAQSAKGKAQQAGAMQKMRSLGTAFASYTTDKNGLLPFEDSTGTDDWQNAAKPENQEAWYNALPRLMNAKTVGELGLSNPIGFYDEGYPLFIPGAPYPGGEKRLTAPIFAIGMNSRLQRKNDDGIKVQGQFAQIQSPSKTVIFLERGLPNDKKTFSGQRGFDGSPKANARSFAARHNQQGALIFADGHAEMHKASDLITSSGTILVPQINAVWTLNPDEDPN